METQAAPVQESINKIAPAHFAEKREFFDNGHTRSYAFRKNQLNKLAAAIGRNESAISEALYADLKKSEAESYLTEIAVVKEELKHTVAQLREWMQPESRPTPLPLHPSSSSIMHVAKGVVLIIAPWNYPFQLAMAPLIGAIAAGNCAVVKPSEDAPKTADLLEKLLEDTFPKEFVSAVQGVGSEVVPELLKKHDFNHIFFTGSPRVGSIIAKQAAEKLTPTTLELGGKSPGIVDKTANLKVAARRLVFGKFTNAGQTCVAPDYLLLHEDIKAKFLAEAKTCIEDFYGKDPKKSTDYGRMINANRFNAVSAYLKEGRILHGGEVDYKENYIAPTLLDQVDMSSTVMQEEIFGPVWPIVTWKDRSDLLRITRALRYPLACYVFTKDLALERFVADEIEFGGGCINNALVHLGNPDLPFGGVMQSGSGAYHGKDSFLAFSHTKSMLKTATWIDPKLKYPPFGKWKMHILRRLIG